MYQLRNPDDTIAAVSTPMGTGGIGIVRLSGRQALDVAGRIFSAKSGRSVAEFKSATVHYGWIVRNSEMSDVRSRKMDIVDEVLLTVMRGPRSYTAEDVVEISCHGSAVSLKAILTLALENGARLAEPGEFTQRAFLNGRIDLTQAEAVLDIINAKTETFLRVSANQLKGELSSELEGIRERLMTVYTELEAVLNFPEDDIDSAGKEALRRALSEAEARIGKLLQTSGHGKILRDGMKIVICGKPNVGKSSLLNVLLRESRAIVTPIAGTTRDPIEESAQIKGIPLRLVDTAGILEPRDMIEEEAVRRSRLLMKSADLVLLVLDASREMTAEDKSMIDAVQGQNAVAVLNKCDLGRNIPSDELEKTFPGRRAVAVSALKKTGIEDLEEAIGSAVLRGEPADAGGVLVSNVRHIQALTACRASAGKAADLLQQGLSAEFVSEEIKTAVNALDSITGRNVDADLLDRIFSDFCIGK
ncbi:MAG: tRNA uridine-5-carboxymethylaminomethyl(34) synthesis GTPase MnmE [Candidatus Omnitrophota bacterium]|nr:tRNA uridine-5-carboxymethylaminomethyl(34) synthesis GTPase MnmE [Candidatus Omnitrophota bacterium]MDZ4241697.1 tRNA uridine-5-carboxymethylaminomethyl(34) synthesis GTPase MnmE [Candidatus Omnitrophota bacterium]